MSRLTPADFARFAATANAARRATRPAPSPPLGRSGVPSGAPLGVRAGRDSLRALRFKVDGMREADSLANVLSDDERAELTMIAYGHLRDSARREFAAQRVRTLQSYSVRVARFREPSLIASMSAPGAAVQGWEGIIGAEGLLTGDGRLIEYGALSAATMPMPLRYAPADHGGHDGALLVGRIDFIERRGGGLIYARGVLDLGSELGREAVRLIGLGMLGGVSMDLDSTAMAAKPVKGSHTSVVSAGRLRAATLVAIPAFDEARITLTDDDCGCTHDGSIHTDHATPNR